MYRFARTPLWLVGHALAGGLLVVFLFAGFWQLGRHGEVQDRNQLVEDRRAARTLDVDRFFEAAWDPSVLARLEYRSVSLPVARFDWEDAVQIRNRSLNGQAGCHLAVPLAAAASPGGGQEGRGVLVVAGWLPQHACDAGASYVEALDGAQHIEGRIRSSQVRGWLGPTDPPDGRLASLARTDVARIDQQASLELVGVYVELTNAAGIDGSTLALEVGALEVGALEVGPSDISTDAERGDDSADGTDSSDAAGRGATLSLLAEPTLDAGPHLGYAIQWFSFAVVAVVGYTLVLRRQARTGDSENVDDD